MRLQAGCDQHYEFVYTDHAHGPGSLDQLHDFHKASRNQYLSDLLIPSLTSGGLMSFPESSSSDSLTGTDRLSLITSDWEARRLRLVVFVTMGTQIWLLERDTLELWR